MDLDEEIRPIKGFDKYFVSNKGNIYSKILGKFKMLKPGYRGQKKYKSVTLYKNKNPHGKYIHLLVLENFLGKCPPGLEACHGANGKDDNSIENLSWKTRKENNSTDKLRDGTLLMGSRHHRSRINERDALLIKFLLQEKKKAKDISIIMNVTLNTVVSIKYNKAWKWLDEPQKQFDGKDFL